MTPRISEEMIKKNYKQLLQECDWNDLPMQRKQNSAWGVRTWHKYEKYVS